MVEYEKEPEDMDNVFKYPPKYGEYGLTEGNT